MNEYYEALRLFVKSILPERMPKDGSEFNKGWNACLSKIQSKSQLLMESTKQIIGG